MLGVSLLARDRRGVSLTGAGEVLLHEGRVALDAATAAVRRTRRAGTGHGAGGSGDRLVPAVKAAASHYLLQKLLGAHAAEPGAAEIEVLPSGMCEQEEMLRDGRAGAALMHAPFDSLAGFDHEELTSEGQLAVLPAAHPLAARAIVTHIAWPAHSRSVALAGLIRTATRL
ncbi:LysR substrate-binding domain-containing protein [Streptomyces sp. NPDC085596]|uniref:LysR substrate-binding domain-containing protein n=1 Tax=Streptomyces sp. NPDC085596 TaxID=3365731 RepID=UPI0037CF80EE